MLRRRFPGTPGRRLGGAVIDIPGPVDGAHPCGGKASAADKERVLAVAVFAKPHVFQKRSPEQLAAGAVRAEFSLQKFLGGFASVKIALFKRILRRCLAFPNIGRHDAVRVVLPGRLQQEGKVVVVRKIVVGIQKGYPGAGSTLKGRVAPPARTDALLAPQQRDVGKILRILFDDGRRTVRQ